MGAAKLAIGLKTNVDIRTRVFFRYDPFLLRCDTRDGPAMDDGERRR